MTSDDINAIIQRNRLLQEQNDLLREQNELLRPKAATSSESEERDVFVEDIDHDEMRAGFLVTSHRKKLWNAQIGLINEFARLCKKHNLRWFAFSGTLLGAARHKGFIPWDDDVDIFMLRPDYEEFKRIAVSEIKPPYFLDAWFNYKLQSEEEAGKFSEEDLQLVTRKQETEGPIWYPFWPMLKFRDSRTAMIQWPDRAHVNQGIWIDIFAFDSAPPFKERQRKINWQIAEILLMAIIFPDKVQEIVANDENSPIYYEDLKKFVGLTHKQRALAFEDFMSQNFFDSECLVDFRDYIIAQRNVTYRASDFRDIVYMPFEKIEVPVPVGYDNILTARYGDWRKPVSEESHAFDYSADISYKEYFQKMAFK